MDRYAERISRARALMRDAGLDFLLVGPSADLYYLIGAQSRPSERLALLALSASGPGFMVLPAFEAPTLPPMPADVQVLTWQEDQDPAALLAGNIATACGSGQSHARCVIGVSDRVWSVFLLRLQAALPWAKFTTAGQVLAEMRQVKSPEEIELLRWSGEAADRVFDEIITRRFSGRSELHVAQELADLLRQAGLRVEGLPIVASGPNSASPHHHAGERIIQHGDAVVLDFGGTYEGYYSDITRTVFVGQAPEWGSNAHRVYEAVAQAQEAAVTAARPGMTCEALDRVARDLLTNAGYGQYFTHRLGHGIGLDGHEPPYLVQGNPTPLRAGMTFSIEPGVYIPGLFGVRIEDIVALHDDGAERLNNATRDIVVVR
jgi:D-alanyl-D-alanine dipeptidase